MTRDSQKITAKVLFDVDGECGAELDRLYRSGMQRGWSIGFVPHEAVWEMYNDKEVLRFTK